MSDNTTATATTATGDKQNPLDMYEIVQVIGKGSFGTVSKIRRKADGRIMVWKELNYGSMREKEKQLVVSEVNILRELKHPFVVRYYDRIIEKIQAKLYIVMEFCEGGDLGAMIKKARKDGTSIDEEFIWKVFSQILIALKECHRHKDTTGKAKPILHRDLKPGNIFLDANSNIKIGDFGLAKELASESKFAYTNVGTPFYMSPEMINELKYNEKSDIWALGCLLFELASLVPPFEATNHLSLAVKINAGKFNRVPMKYSEDLHRAIRWMLQVDSTKRPSVEELEKLPRLKPSFDRATIYIRDLQKAKEAASGKTTPTATPAVSKEEELARRETEIAKKEAELNKREQALNDWERNLRDRENNLTTRSSSLTSTTAMGTTLPRPATTGSSFGLPPQLHRAHSTSELPIHSNNNTNLPSNTFRRVQSNVPTVTVNIANASNSNDATTGPIMPSVTSTNNNNAMDADPLSPPTSSENTIQRTNSAIPIKLFNNTGVTATTNTGTFGQVLSTNERPPSRGATSGF